MTDKIVVLSACESREEALRVAEALLEKRLAACVNLLPGAESMYHWKGKIERSEETVLLIKSTRKCFEQLKAVLSQAHSYEIPEVLALPVVAGSEGYLDWMDREMKVAAED